MNPGELCPVSPQQVSRCRSRQNVLIQAVQHGGENSSRRLPFRWASRRSPIIFSGKSFSLSVFDSENLPAYRLSTATVGHIRFGCVPRAGWRDNRNSSPGCRSRLLSGCPVLAIVLSMFHVLSFGSVVRHALSLRTGAEDQVKRDPGAVDAVASDSHCQWPRAPRGTRDKEPSSESWESTARRCGAAIVVSKA